MRVVLLLCVALVYAGCEILKPVEVSGGTILARVVFEDTLRQDPLFTNVGIPEVGVSAQWDSTNEYSFSNLLPGTYSLKVSSYWDNTADTIITGIRIGMGETKRIPDVLIPAAAKRLDDTVLTAMLNGYWLVPDSTNVRYQDYPNTLMLTSELFYRVNASPKIPAETEMKVFHNGESIFDSIPPKGWAQIGPVNLGLIDTFEVIIDDRSMGRLVLADLSLKEPVNSLHIQTGISVLKKAPPLSFNGFYVSGPDSFTISYKDTEAVDWDIALVNRTTRDTCWWGNPNAITSLIYYPGKSLGKTVYTADEVDSYDLLAGRYSVYVQFYGGNMDSATPTIHIELGKTGYNQIMNYVQMSPPMPMTKGQIWHAADIQMPERQLIRVDTLAGPVVPAFPKQKTAI